MHDPMTVAWEIKLPFWRTHKLGKSSYRQFYTLATIWHVDPELDGSDDSCGWFRPPKSEVHREIIKWLAHDEARNPWILSLAAKTNPDPVKCEAYVRGAFLVVSRCMKHRGVLRREVTLEEATVWAIDLVHNPMDNIRSSLAWLSGYHGNNYHSDRPNTEEEDIWFREQSASDFFSCILGCILRNRRHWWEHPRWHVMHWKRPSVWDETEGKFVRKGLPHPAIGWKISIHSVQTFKRWAFSRCCKCGGRFTWGYSPTTNSWNGTGPKWFRSEADVFHGDCDHPASNYAHLDK